MFIFVLNKNTMNKEKTVNPFVLDRTIDVMVIKRGSKEDDNTYVEKSKYCIETQRKVNMYYDTHGEIDELLFGKLTPKGRDLFLYIAYHIPENKDYVNLKLSTVKGKIGISRNAMVTALQSLKNAGVITPKSQSVYWINPFFFFKGNRLTYFKELGGCYLNVVNIIKNVD